jgi:hypothetical protein
MIQATFLTQAITLTVEKYLQSKACLHSISGSCQKWFLYLLGLSNSYQKTPLTKRRRLSFEITGPNSLPAPNCSSIL